MNVVPAPTLLNDGFPLKKSSSNPTRCGKYSISKVFQLAEDVGGMLPQVIEELGELDRSLSYLLLLFHFGLE